MSLYDRAAQFAPFAALSGYDDMISEEARLVGNRIELSEEEIKQDCESKAFKRLAEKLKMKFPRLPICIVADGLYVSDPVIQICKDNHWDYIIRYKDYQNKCNETGKCRSKPLENRKSGI